MDCTESRQRLLDYREKQLVQEEQMEVEAHLRVCAECEKELRDFESFLSAIAALPAPDPWPGFDRRLRARMSETARANRVKGWWGLRLNVKWAGACIALVLFAGGALWSLFLKVESNTAVHGVQPETSAGGRAGTSLFRERERNRNPVAGLWDTKNRDWTEVHELPNKHLALLALAKVEMSPAEVVKLWNSEQAENRAVEELVEITGITDSMVERLLNRMSR